MPRRLARATLAAAFALLCGCSSTSSGTAGGGEAPAPVVWKFESVSWYNRYSMNSTIGPTVVGKTVLYGGTYAYQNTKASKLAAVDATTGTARWRMEYGAAFGPMVLADGTIAVAAGDGVLGLDFASGVQRWEVPLRPRSLTAAGDVVLLAGRNLGVAAGGVIGEIAGVASGREQNHGADRNFRNSTNHNPRAAHCYARKPCEYRVRKTNTRRRSARMRLHHSLLDGNQGFG